ncbi:transcriptional regulator, fis family domain protein [Mycobacterium sp. MAC_080597_8934]|nr:transcriptional regulator, fis family domain protein [Mycobacterium sp. MAC_080597_8934]
MAARRACGLRSKNDRKPDVRPTVDGRHPTVLPRGGPDSGPAGCGTAGGCPPDLPRRPAGRRPPGCPAAPAARRRRPAPAAPCPAPAGSRSAACTAATGWSAAARSTSCRRRPWGWCRSRTSARSPTAARPAAAACWSWPGWSRDARPGSRPSTWTPSRSCGPPRWPRTGRWRRSRAARPAPRRRRRAGRRRSARRKFCGAVQRRLTSWLTPYGLRRPPKIGAPQTAAMNGPADRRI